MVPIPNPRVVYTKIPTGLPMPGEHIVYDNTPTIDLENVPLNGGFLTKTLILSLEPYLRDRMRDRSIQSYSTIMTLGKAVVGTGVVVVLRSEDEKVKVGDYMVGNTPWAAFSVQPYDRDEFKPEDWSPWTFDMDSLELHPVSNPGNALRWETFCGALGTPGLTGWTAFEEYTNAKPGETIYVSAGLSAVGQMVIQIAKMRGLTVIASTGSPEKVKILQKLGADVAFNYRETSIEGVLSKHGPLHIYWDNVAGRTLDCAIQHMALHGKIIMCGLISELSTPMDDRPGIMNLSEIMKRRVTIQGILVTDLIGKHGGRFFTEIPPLVAQGKIQAVEDVTHGLENAPHMFLRMLKEGGTSGKPIIVVAEQ